MLMSGATPRRPCRRTRAAAGASRSTTPCARGGSSASRCRSATRPPPPRPAAAGRRRRPGAGGAMPRALRCCRCLLRLREIVHEHRELLKALLDASVRREVGERTVVLAEMEADALEHEAQALELRASARSRRRRARSSLRRLISSAAIRSASPATASSTSDGSLVRALVVQSSGHVGCDPWRAQER